MNLVVIAPILLVTSGLFVFLTPTVDELFYKERGSITLLSTFLHNQTFPLSIAALMAASLLLSIYAVLVSIFLIVNLSVRQYFAALAGIVFMMIVGVILSELHIILLRYAFEYAHPGIAGPGGAVSENGEFLASLFTLLKNFFVFVSPLALAALPFLQKLGKTALSGEGERFGDIAKRISSRVILFVTAAIIPVALWIVWMQTVYWGIAIPCSEPAGFSSCAEGQLVSWPQAPSFLQWLFHHAPYFSQQLFSYLPDSLQGLFHS